MTAQMKQTRSFFKALGALALLTTATACNANSGVTSTNDAGSSASAVSFGTAEGFAVLGGTTVTNLGPTIVTGNLGVSPGTAVTGFPPGSVLGGSIHAADAVALQAQADTITAYDALVAEPCDFTYDVPTDLGGMTLVPGVYCFASSVQVTGTLTLDAQGDPASVFVFKAVSTLITASNASVLMTNGGTTCNVFWKVGSSATIGTGTAFAGSIVALTSIALETDASLLGRALARNGAVTLDSNVVSIAGCTQLPPTPGTPSLAKSFSPATIEAGELSTVTITLVNPDATVAALIAPLVDVLPSGLEVAGTPSTDCGGTLTSDDSSVTLTAGSIPANGSCTIVFPVTAVCEGSYTNSLSAGALLTGNGANVASAEATLIVGPDCVRPSLEKSFTPATIAPGATSTLVITLRNPGTSPADLIAPLTDDFPTGMLVSGVATTTCEGSAATTGVLGTSVTLMGGAIQPGSSCTVTVDVTAAVPGTWWNTLGVDALQTTSGSNEVEATASLTVTDPI